MSKLLVQYGAFVIMACPDQENCDSVADKIKRQFPKSEESIVSRSLNFQELESIWNFTQYLKTNFERIDITIINSFDEIKTEFQWESIYIGHFALTNWLLPLLQKPCSSSDLTCIKGARFVNFATPAAFISGNLNCSLMKEISGFKAHSQTPLLPQFTIFGRTESSGTANAQLASILFGIELQRRVDVAAR